MNYSKALILPTAFMLLSACVTSENATSTQVQEFNTQDEMLERHTCERVGDVFVDYNVFFHTPSGRRNAGHVRLKEAAHAKGGNAVILTAQVAVFGQVNDQVKGVAYKCQPKRPTK